MRVYICLTLAFLVLNSCTEAQSPADAQASTETTSQDESRPLIEIADGRNREQPDDMAEWFARPSVQRAGQQAIDAISNYWRERQPNFAAEPFVYDIADGSFTAPNVQQRAVLFNVAGPMWALPAGGIAIHEDDRLVRLVSGPFGGVEATLSAVPDLNEDGRDELFWTASFAQGGSEEYNSSLFWFDGDSFARWTQSSLYQGPQMLGGEECDSSFPMDGDGGGSASRLLARPGPEPGFVEEHYTRAACGEAWQAEGEPDVHTRSPVEDDFDTLYVDLPVR